MKKLLLSLFGVFFAMSTPVFAQNLTEQLPVPNMSGGKPLMEALKDRKADRSFADTALDPQVISDMLWAGYGVNRDDGKRTVPTAQNKQNMDVYLLRSDGAWLYDGKNNTLKQVVTDDLRSMLGGQEFARKAPVTLLFVAENSIVSGLHAGSVYQNVGLYCASVGLNNVVRLSHDTQALNKALGLSGNTSVLASQSIGYPNS